MSELLGVSFIGFGRGSDDGKSFHAEDRVAGKPLEPPYYACSIAELEKAASLASSIAWEFATMDRLRRAEFLRAIAAEMESRKDAIVARAMAETALPEGRIVGELGRTTGQLRFFAAIVEDGGYLDVRIDRAEPDRQQIPKPDLRSMMRPLGPAAVFGASNFPLAYSVAGGDTASALAAGCPVIVKAHPAHPGTSEIVAQAVISAAKKTNMPEGVFSVLFDGGLEIGQALVQHPAIKAVGFTGSQRGGLALQCLAWERPEPIPVYAEMGSVNPVVFMPEKLASDPEGMAKALHASATLGVGQFCTNPGVVFLVGQSGRDEFVGTYAELMQNTPSATMLTASIGDSYLACSSALAAVAGVKQLVKPSTPGAPAVNVVESSVFMAHPALQEEVFGPATLLVLCDSVLDAVTAIGSMEGQLTGSIHGLDSELSQAGELAHALERKVGRLIFNQFPTGLEVCNAVVHGGPFPATTDSRTTSVGGRAILRWVRPVCYQNFPQELLPVELRD